MGEMVSSLDPESVTDMEHPKAPSNCKVRTEAWLLIGVVSPYNSIFLHSLVDLGRVDDPVKTI